GGHGDGGAQVNVVNNMEEAAASFLTGLKNAGIVAEVDQDRARTIIDDELARVKAELTRIGREEIARIKAEAVREAMRKSKGNKLWRYLVKPAVTVSGLGLLAYTSFYGGVRCGLELGLHIGVSLPFEFLNAVFMTRK
ncbi:hypothetical protein U9M48_011710, partial [Paspalum notatum var. saurae]